MDETKTPSVDEMLENPKKHAVHIKAMLSAADKQATDFRAAAAADEMNVRTGYRTQRVEGEVHHDMRTDDDKKNEATADATLKNLRKLAGIGGDPKSVKDTLNSCFPSRREDAYPTLSKGKLLFQTEEYDSPKEYITLGMNENKELVKKILDQRGCLTGHPEIPVDALEWNMPNLDQITEAISKEFPDEKMLIEKNHDITDRISKLLGDVPVSFDRSNYKLIVRSVRTKWDIREVNAAVTALAILIPPKEAERLVAREIAKKIQNVL